MFNLLKKNIDLTNIILIFITCGLSHVLPYHLLIFSYAVLGPAHYLTQISWLHDKKYFSHFSWLAPTMGLLSFMLLVCFFCSSLIGASITLSLALCLAFIATPPNKNFSNHVIAYILIFIFGFGLIGFSIYSPQTALFISTLLPTIIHVFVFTAAFMWLGAIKSHNKIAYLAFLSLIIGAGTFLIPHSVYEVLPNLEGIKFFKPVVEFIQKIGFSHSTEAQLFGFLSYIYTYHYLNWFSKAEIIHWYKIPQPRMVIIVVFYILSLSIYISSYTIGFLIILLLSYMHVMLEFPLNVQSFILIIKGSINLKAKHNTLV